MKFNLSKFIKAQMEECIHSVHLNSFTWNDSDDGFFYHVTSVENEQSIYNSKFIYPSSGGGMFQGAAARSNSKGKIFVCKKNNVRRWAGEIENQLFHSRDFEEDEDVENYIAVLKIPNSFVKNPQPDSMGNMNDFFTTEKIPVCIENDDFDDFDDFDTTDEKLEITAQNTNKELDEKVNSELKNLMISWGKEGIESFVYCSRGEITLSSIKIPKNKRGQGLGTAKIKELLQIAQKYNIRVLLTPSTDFGASSVGRLKNFYKNVGFVDNKGTNKDYRTRETMIWQPKNSKSSSNSWYSMSKINKKS